MAPDCFAFRLLMMHSTFSLCPTSSSSPSSLGSRKISLRFTIKVFGQVRAHRTPCLCSLATCYIPTLGKNPHDDHWTELNSSTSPQLWTVTTPTSTMDLAPLSKCTSDPAERRIQQMCMPSATLMRAPPNCRTHRVCMSSATRTRAPPSRRMP